MGFRASKWHGLKSLVHDAIDASVNLVDVGHESTMRTVRAVADQVEPLRDPVRAIDDARRFSTRAVLATIKVVNRGVQSLTDAALDAALAADAAEIGAQPALPMRSDAASTAAWLVDATQGLVNAAVGDQLRATRNGLDMSMVFRVADHYVPARPDVIASVLEAPSPRVALFVHGLGTTEWSWCLQSESYYGNPSTSFGSLLQDDLGYTPVYLRYNTGRRISDNGRLLAKRLERFVAAYPVPIEELVLVGHSMGGLVVRSACHYAVREGHQWPRRVRHVFCLGAPHRGAPLAKLGHRATALLDRIDLPATQIGARILASRSAGIKDLRVGAIIDEDWQRADPDLPTDAELLSHARHYFVSATITDDPDHPVGHLVGDLLVRVPSSTGPALRQAHFAIETRRYGGILHHQLQNHPSVYAELRNACASRDRAEHPGT